MDLVALAPLADIAPPRNQGIGALPVILALVAAVVVIGVIVLVVRSRK